MGVPVDVRLKNSFGLFDSPDVGFEPEFPQSSNQYPSVNRATELLVCREVRYQDRGRQSTPAAVCAVPAGLVVTSAGTSKPRTQYWMYWPGPKSCCPCRSRPCRNRPCRRTHLAQSAAAGRAVWTAVHVLALSLEERLAYQIGVRLALVNHRSAGSLYTHVFQRHGRRRCLSIGETVNADRHRTGQTQLA